MERVKEFGSSVYDDRDGIDHYFEYNRARPDESTLSKEGILDQYCRIDSTEDNDDR